MGDEPRGTQGTESLDSSVGTLLEDAYRTCERIEQTLAERPPLVETPPPPAASPSLDSDVGTLVKEARAATAVSDGVDPSLEVVGNLSELDSDLASLADNLFESETPASPAAPPGDQSAPVAAVAVPAANPVPTQAAAQSPPASPAQQTPAAGTSAATSAAPKPPAAEPQAAEPAAPVTPVEQGLPPARDAAKILVGAIAPAALTALDAMSFPLRNKPRVVRDTVGWLALWTLFLSGSLWVYVIFFHEPVGPAATAPALEFVGAEGRQPRVHASSEETKGESHEAKGANEHGGSEKASEASAEKSASKEDHGGH